MKGSEIGYSLQTIERTLDQNERLAHRQENKVKQQQAQKAIGRGLKHRSGPVKELKTGISTGSEMAGGMKYFLHLLLRAEESGGSSFDPWKEEQRLLQQRRKKKRHRPRL